MSYFSCFFLLFPPAVAAAPAPATCYSFCSSCFLLFPPAAAAPAAAPATCYSFCSKGHVQKAVT